MHFFYEKKTFLPQYAYNNTCTQNIYFSTGAYPGTIDYVTGIGNSHTFPIFPADIL